MAKKKVSKRKPNRAIIKPARPTKTPRTAAKAPKARTKGNQGADWQQLTAADVMQRNLVTVSTSTPLSEVEQILSENRITGVPVTDEAGHIAGVLSSRDLMERRAQEPEASQQDRGYFSVPTNELEEEDLEAFVAPSGSGSEATAGELMTAQVFTVAADAGLRKVAAVMVKHSIHRLLVQQQSRTVGIVTSTDLLRVMAR